MALATALLHTAGLALILSLRHWRLEKLAPYGGLAILGGGILLATT